MQFEISSYRTQSKLEGVWHHSKNELWSPEYNHFLQLYLEKKQELKIVNENLSGIENIKRQLTPKS